MTPDFTKSELIPAIIQDSITKNVLMLGYMNKESFEITERSGNVTFFSRSKNRLWTKGETSGNFLEVVSIALDCDNDTILVMATPSGPTCHLENDTCFSENENRGTDLGFLNDIIRERKNNPSPTSYTNQLLNNIDKAAQKVGEEAVELVIEAKDTRDDRFIEEAADLMYHYLVLIEAKDMNFTDVIDVLRRRMK